MNSLIKKMRQEAFRWSAGRQGTGYQRMLILTAKWPVPFDLYLIKYPTGSWIPQHVDPVEPNFRHFRLNVILKRAQSGGQFVVKKCIWASNRIKLFRPDTEPHEVLRVTQGSRWVLSLGWKCK